MDKQMWQAECVKVSERLGLAVGDMWEEGDNYEMFEMADEAFADGVEPETFIREVFEEDLAKQAYDEDLQEQAFEQEVDFQDESADDGYGDYDDGYDLGD